MRTPLALAAALAAAPASAQLTVRATLPPDTPADAAVHVAGTFNGWNPGAAAWKLARQPDGTWAITLPDSVRGPVELKLTRGSWATVETTALGADVPNRTVVVPPSGAATLDVAVSGWRDRFAPTVRRSTASPNVRVVRDSFPMPQLGRARRVWLYLPPDYATSGRRYPVLYLHDGQNVFDEATSFAGEWGVDESLDSLHASGDPGVIVVAVDHGGDRRLDEYDPWRNPDPKLGGGEGDAYVDFLVHTLKPWVDAHYRTRPDAAHTGVMGSSMGGLISLYATLKYPRVFGRAGVFSCACWIAGRHVYAYARAHARAAHAAGARLYFVAGALETPTGEPARDQRRMVDTLLAAGYPRSAIHDAVAADGRHAEWFWRREFPAAYRWLFR
jgi:metallo-beta-lactamase class B